MRGRSRSQQGQLLAASTESPLSRIEAMQNLKEEQEAGLHNLIARHFRSPELRRLAERVIIDRASRGDGAGASRSARGTGSGSIRNTYRSIHHQQQGRSSLGDSKSKSFRGVRSTRQRSSSPPAPRRQSKGASSTGTASSSTRTRTRTGGSGTGSGGSSSATRSFKQPATNRDADAHGSSKFRHRRSASTASTKLPNYNNLRQTAPASTSSESARRSEKSFRSATVSSRQRAKALPQRRSSEVIASSKTRREMRAARSRNAKTRPSVEDDDNDSGSMRIPVVLSRLPATVEAAIEEDAAQDVWDDIEIDPAALPNFDVQRGSPELASEMDKDLADDLPSKSELSALAASPSSALTSSLSSSSSVTSTSPKRSSRSPPLETIKSVDANENDAEDDEDEDDAGIPSLSSRLSSPRTKRGARTIHQLQQHNGDFSKHSQKHHNSRSLSKQRSRPENDSWADLSLPSVEGENDEPVLESGAGMHEGPFLLPFRDSSFKQHTVGQMTFNPLLQRWENSCNDEEQHIMEAFDAASWSSDDGESGVDDDEDDDDEDTHLFESRSSVGSKPGPPLGNKLSAGSMEGIAGSSATPFDLTEADLTSFRRSEELSRKAKGLSSAPHLPPLEHQDLVQLAMERILVANQAKNHQNFSFSASNSGP
eukprot:CAMPEP_0171574834 /NCGR_PEP_ID=MMETSP0961-20121227/5624_1 /TAXON_ID=87120 /ORGANISM="Aurantiochytrium limacinum, Strain ATCCMYA-1381" /LENGTH=652 /DNA_ID=CAMNT_0012130287 /DNA_START=570 /DNA_END=2528 /DNA_ORIENTATION=+